MSMESVERKKINQIYYSLLLIPKSRAYRFLIRLGNFRPVGLITKREQLFDSGIGKSRDWVAGLAFDKQTFKEPLDYINDKTGELESCIVAENEFFIFTNRNTNDITDDPDNFQWLATPQQMNAWHELVDQIQMKNNMVSSLQTKVISITESRDSYRKSAGHLGSENRDLKSMNERLVSQMSEVNQQNALAIMNAHKSRKSLIEDHAEMNHGIATASITGKAKAMNFEELTFNALKTSQKNAEIMASFLPDNEEYMKIIKEQDLKLKEQDERIKKLETTKKIIKTDEKEETVKT